MMDCTKVIPLLKGDNYGEWKRKLDLAFVLGEVDWVLTEPRPIEPVGPVRADGEEDGPWQARLRDFAPIWSVWDLKRRQWDTTNKKCLAVVKNTIDNSLLGSIPECDTITEYLQKIKDQFTGSSKVYATTLLRQFVNERYTGGGIREHILRMSNMESKLRPLDLGFKEPQMVHMVMASLPKQFENFVSNYNMLQEKWSFQQLIAHCVEEEERIKASNGGSINYVHHKQKKNFQPNNGASSSKFKGKQPEVPNNRCHHCKKEGHFKSDCPDFLKSIMAKKGIPFDKDYAKKRKFH